MGRGRQKAKQTKVARQLKYFSPDTDYTALQRELAVSTGAAGNGSHVVDEDVEEEPDDDDGEFAHWSPGSRH